MTRVSRLACVVTVEASASACLESALSTELSCELTLCPWCLSSVSYAEQCKDDRVDQTHYGARGMSVVREVTICSWTRG
jgi:hypothetical protein